MGTPGLQAVQSEKQPQRVSLAAAPVLGLVHGWCLLAPTFLLCSLSTQALLRLWPARQPAPEADRAPLKAPTGLAEQGSGIKRDQIPVSQQDPLCSVMEEERTHTQCQLHCAHSGLPLRVYAEVSPKNCLS